MSDIIDVQTSDISLAARVMGQFPEALTPEQRVPDNLAELGKLTLTPSIGVLYYDENFNEYYYGISGNESRRSGLSSYSPGDSWTPYVGLSAKYALTSNLTLLASAPLI